VSDARFGRGAARLIARRQEEKDKQQKTRRPNNKSRLKYLLGIFTKAAKKQNAS
jgi:hypothetical protein